MKPITKQRVNLCKCNQCNNLLIDTNPKINAPFYIPCAQLIAPLDRLKEGTHFCPNCNTDEYLTDDIQYKDIAGLAARETVTPLQRANELIYKFRGGKQPIRPEWLAIEGAEVCVREIMEELKKQFPNYLNDTYWNTIDFYELVLNELIPMQL